MTNDQLIKEWQNEYLRVNGRYAPDVVYERGWFWILDSPGIRKGDFVKMIANLKERNTYGED